MFQLNQGVLKTFLLVLLLAGGSVLAKESRKIQIPRTMSLNGVELQPGSYRLIWETNSPEVSVTLLSGAKIVARGAGTIVERNQAYNTDTVVSKMLPTGTEKLTEIRFRGRNQVIVFN
ncbi:MAG: hypothetical protein HY645_05760 [Acidobacteria bacterium]|nr:hypothetical protein [Acidobacteriota bacterium]